MPQDEIETVPLCPITFYSNKMPTTSWEFFITIERAASWVTKQSLPIMKNYRYRTVGPLIWWQPLQKTLDFHSNIHHVYCTQLFLHAPHCSAYIRQEIWPTCNDVTHRNKLVLQSTPNVWFTRGKDPYNPNAKKTFLIDIISLK